MYVYGFLYREIFDPFDPFRNQIVGEFDNCGKGQFRLYIFLQAKITYILVIATLSTNMAGPFSIMAIGAANINFTRLGEY